MSEVTIKLPQNIEEREARLALAIELFRDGRITVTQAAQLAGTSPDEFTKIFLKKERLSREDRALLRVIEETLRSDWESEEDKWWDEY